MRTVMAAALLLVVCAAAPAVPGTPEPEEFGLMVAAPGASETFYACTPCHSERIVVQQGLTREQWDEVLDLMVEEHEMEPIDGRRQNGHPRLSGASITAPTARTSRADRRHYGS